MYPNYNSELNYIGNDCLDMGLVDSLSDKTLTELLDMQAKLQHELNEHRENEPKRKRENKFEYHCWIARTQNILDDLKEIQTEIIYRQK